MISGKVIRLNRNGDAEIVFLLELKVQSQSLMKKAMKSVLTPVTVSFWRRVLFILGLLSGCAGLASYPVNARLNKLHISCT